jgi:hypothetical protein
LVLVGDLTGDVGADPSFADSGIGLENELLLRSSGDFIGFCDVTDAEGLWLEPTESFPEVEYFMLDATDVGDI